MFLGTESIVERECRTVTQPANLLAASVSHDNFTMVSFISQAYTLSAPDLFAIMLSRIEIVKSTHEV